VAEPLAESDRETIRKALSTHFNREVKFNESIDPSLVGGVKLQFGSFVIDGTMSNMLQEAAVRLRTESKRKYQSVTQ
jgi:F-type H+-transporting ATPase subunit delta